ASRDALEERRSKAFPLGHRTRDCRALLRIESRIGPRKLCKLGQRLDQALLAPRSEGFPGVRSDLAKLFDRSAICGAQRLMHSPQTVGSTLRDCNQRRTALCREAIARGQRFAKPGLRV